MTNNEQTIAMAAWLRGVAIGLATIGDKAFHRRSKKSWLVGAEGTRIFQTADQILSGGAFNPIDVYEMVDAAKRLGFGQPQHQACEAIHQALFGE